MESKYLLCRQKSLSDWIKRATNPHTRDGMCHPKNVIFKPTKCLLQSGDLWNTAYHNFQESFCSVNFIINDSTQQFNSHVAVFIYVYSCTLQNQKWRCRLISLYIHSSSGNGFQLIRNCANYVNLKSFKVLYQTLPKYVYVALK